MAGLIRHVYTDFKRTPLCSLLLSRDEWRGLGFVRCVVVLVCLALMAVGCSSAERAAVEESGEDWQSFPLAGMWIKPFLKQ